jgi:tetratricopeptide (TPR) repeat protein
MRSPTKEDIQGEPGAINQRLDCWKEVASYLGKGERTAKRWEAERGLPIHRFPGPSRTTIYAYTAELDEWLKLRGAQEQGPVVEPVRQFAADLTTEYESASQAATATRDEQNMSRQESARSWHDRRRRWTLALAGLALAGVAVSGFRLAAIHHRVSRDPLGTSSAVVKNASAVASSVSDSDEQRAHDLYLSGRYEWNQRTPASLNRALDDFTQAIVHNPSYALAYVGMADTSNLLREYSTMPDSEAYTRSIVAAKKAIALDDSLAEAHRALAFAEYYGMWNFIDAEREFRRAIELDPKDPTAHKWYANAIVEQGRFQDSLAEMEKAQELDPSSNSLMADKGVMLFHAGRRQEGLDLLREVELSAPGFRSPHFQLMGISMELRDFPSYLAEGKKVAETTNDNVLKDIMASAQTGFERGGERGLLTILYAKQREYYLQGKVSGTDLAKTCIAMGRRQEALQLLEEAYKVHDSFVLECGSHSDLRTLREEPRFQELMRKLNYPSSSEIELIRRSSPKAPSAPIDTLLRTAFDRH